MIIQASNVNYSREDCSLLSSYPQTKTRKLDQKVIFCEHVWISLFSVEKSNKIQRAIDTIGNSHNVHKYAILKY